MKTITIRELHEQTEQVVRRTVEEDGFVITEHGEPLAILTPARGPKVRGNSLPKRDPATLPTARGTRPQVGEVTSAPVRWSEESFAALDEGGMKELGLL